MNVQVNRKDIIEAWKILKEYSQISDETLDFIRDAALEKFDGLAQSGAAYDRLMRGRHET